MEEEMVKTGVDTSSLQELQEHYKIVSTLGYGTFAQVKLAHHRLTNFLVAIKITSVEEDSGYSFTDEVTVMKELRHQNIIHLFHVIQIMDHMCMVLEYASGGDLGKIISELGRLREAQAQDIFAQVLSAVDYCHGHDIAHRDITPQHILFTADRRCKLSHFALASCVTKGQKLQTRGSPLFCAPEVLSGRPYDEFLADMWSLGVVLFNMTTGSLLMEDSTDWMLDFQILASPQMSTGITDVLEHLLSVSPGLRPTAGQLLQHPWVKDVKESPRPCVRETFPRIPNPTTLGAMFHLGYKPSDVMHCIQEKVYNDILATYLIMSHHGPCGDCPGKEPQAEIEASATRPSEVPSFPPSLRRSLSLPGLSTLARPDSQQKIIKKWGRAHSCRPTLCCPPAQAPPQVPEAAGPMSSSSSEMSFCSLESECSPMSECSRIWELASCGKLRPFSPSAQDEQSSSESSETMRSLSPIARDEETSTLNSGSLRSFGYSDRDEESSSGSSGSMRSLSSHAQDEETSSGSSRSVRSLSSSTHNEESSLVSEDTPMEVNTAASTRSRRWSWHGVKRRMGKGLRTLCCCLPARSRSPTGLTEDVKVDAGDFGTPDENRGDSLRMKSRVDGMGQPSTQICQPGSQAGGAGGSVLPSLAQTPPSRGGGGLSRLIRSVHVRLHRSAPSDGSPPPVAQHGLARNPSLLLLGEHPEPRLDEELPSLLQRPCDPGFCKRVEVSLERGDVSPSTDN